MRDELDRELYAQRQNEEPQTAEVAAQDTLERLITASEDALKAMAARNGHTRH